MTFQDLQSFRRYRGLKSEVVDDVHAKVDLIGKKKFSKMFSEKIHGDIDPRRVCKFCEIWLTGNRSHALVSARIAPKISLGLLQTIYSESPKFHPNPFTSGRVIAERVNIVETRHKVFPILQLLRRVNIHTNAITVLMLIQMYIVVNTTRMWANAQPDGRPAEHRWRPLFNAAKFG